MWKLKYNCPFGGKQYPLYVATAIFIIVPMFTVLHDDWSLPAAYALTVFCEFVALLICHYIEQRLTPAERELIDESAPPLWIPASQNVCEVAADMAHHIGGFALTAVALCAGCAIAALFPKHGEPNFTLAKIMAILCGLILLCDFIRRMIWKTIDNTAVYTVIPIDHMYETTVHTRRGSYTVSYLVFYQPDGRYILRAKRGTGDCDSIAVIKYHGMVTWVPYFFDPVKIKAEQASMQS